MNRHTKNTSNANDNAGLIWIFANSLHPEQTIIVSEVVASSELDALESVDKAAGWICVFSILVADVPANLRALAASLNMRELDHLLDLAPATITHALHRVAHGELEA